MSVQTDFISNIRAAAQGTQAKYGILASVTIAQAILESGWGQHAIGNNLFGIKTNGWPGKTTTVYTKEYENGKYVTVAAAFRAYASVGDSILDHGAFLAGNERYKNIFGNKNAEQVCRLLEQDGYATDPSYAEQLIGLIRQYNLTQYDVAATPAKPVAHTETVTNGTYSVRTKPSLLGGVLGFVRRGQAFQTAVVASGWRQISYNGRVAYVGPAAFR